MRNYKNKTQHLHIPNSYVIIVCSLFILCLAPTLLFAQTPQKPKNNAPRKEPQERTRYEAVEMGDFNINLGVGWPSVLYREKQLTQETPAISGSFEYMVNDGLGIGLYLGYLGAKDNSSYKYRYAIGGPRISYRFFVNERFDVYASMVGLVTYADVRDQNGAKPPSSNATEDYNFGFATYLGGRYLITENFGIYTELGWGVALINLGATARF